MFTAYGAIVAAILEQRNKPQQYSVTLSQTLLPPSKLGGELEPNDHACSRQLLPPIVAAVGAGPNGRRKVK